MQDIPRWKECTQKKRKILPAHNKGGDEGNWRQHSSALLFILWFLILALFFDPYSSYAGVSILKAISSNISSEN